MKKMVTYLILASLLMTAACTRYRENDTEDKLEKIQQKIDNAQYEESIQELNEILQKEPGNDRARSILASAYVHRAGIEVKEYFELANLFTEEIPVGEPVVDLESLKKLSGEQSEKIKELTGFLEKLNATANMAHVLSQRFESITDISNESAKDLYTALQVLEKLHSPTDGMILFRGVIKLYYFKFLWTKGSLIPVGNGKLCALQVGDIAQKLRLFKDFAVGMVIDISKGFPKETREIVGYAESLDQHIQKAQGQLKKMKSSLTLKQFVSTKLKEINMRNFSCDF